jgi:hypothetical protein
MGARSVAAVILASLLATAPARAGGPLETETARLAPKGTFETDVAVELQTSSDGREFASPIAIAYSLSNRLEVLAEPVPITTIRPSSGVGASGVGDFELTLTGLVFTESRSRPAMALAGEVKFPTGESPTIGSGETDYTAYGVASKAFGRWDTHANLGYTVVGHPPGTSVSNTVNYAAALEWTTSPRWTLLAEIVGNTSALAEASPSSESSVTPEISGGETIGMVGARYQVAQGLKGYLGIAVDNNGAVLFRPGFSARF